MIPFMMMIVLVGMPLLLLELGLGQKLRVGSAAAWPKVSKGTPSRARTRNRLTPSRARAKLETDLLLLELEL